MTEQKHDPIVRPSHYAGTYGLECLDAIRNMLTPEQYVGFLRGNQLKYLWRFAKKNGQEDLRKANQLGQWLLQAITEAKATVTEPISKIYAYDLGDKTTEGR